MLTRTARRTAPKAAIAKQGGRVPHPIARVLRPFRELTVNQVIMLAVVYDGPATVRGIAAAMGVSKSFITRGADRFEDIGLARRREDPDDRRSIRIEITAKGRRLLDAVRS
jgi:DNA-binding MarR family transcriptional regulator